jgi:hypothetical protein
MNDHSNVRGRLPMGVETSPPEAGTSRGSAPCQVAWVQRPPNGDVPGPRSGHSITVRREQALLFGGCGVKGSQPQVFREAYLLHISDGYRWERLQLTGLEPSPRWRHTATLLPDDDSVFVFGGVCRGDRYNDAHVFSFRSRAWKPAETAGAPPHPRSHHTASLVEFDAAQDGHAEKKLFIVGGYGEPRLRVRTATEQPRLQAERAAEKREQIGSADRQHSPRYLIAFSRLQINEHPSSPTSNARRRSGRDV